MPGERPVAPLTRSTGGPPGPDLIVQEKAESLHFVKSVRFHHWQL